VEQKLAAAWNMSGYAEARRAIEQIESELERINPSAARSLAEGMEETLTLHRLGCRTNCAPLCSPPIRLNRHFRWSRKSAVE
jgi:hypothetical protein